MEISVKFLMKALIATLPQYQRAGFRQMFLLATCIADVESKLHYLLCLWTEQFCTFNYVSATNTTHFTPENAFWNILQMPNNALNIQGHKTKYAMLRSHKYTG